MSLDIHTAVQTALVLAVIAAAISLWRGIANIRSGRKLPFFRMRRERMLRGWRLLFWTAIFLLLAFLLNNQAEPLIYSYFPATATVTMTPTVTQTSTITITPSVTLSPTITKTPSVTDTPTVTPTPHVPLAIEMRFESSVTPSGEALFSGLTFSDGLDENYLPLNPGTVFQNPINHMYALFSYDSMTEGAQWTALWYREDELVHYETIPWNGGTGGLGYTDWNPEPSEWISGTYTVQLFVGMQFKVAGQFLVEGEPPTPLPTETATPTATDTRTPVPTWTSAPTRTPVPTWTPVSTRTLRPTRTETQIPTVTSTRTPFTPPTHTPTITTWPTSTRTPVTPTITPQPTLTRTPTPTRRS